MPRNLSITEPHPTVPKSGGYIYGGRGGAGNYRRYKPEEVTTGPSATGPASRISLTKPFKRTVPLGRGGAGNMSSASNEESIFEFDEEMLNKRAANAAPIYHVGRGGAGNLFTEPTKKSASSRKDSTDSSSSAESERITAMRRNSGGVLSIFSRRSS
ncbi:hypothetical protein M409DRAFT_64570 [Zasmidium cellare ATCC 36951]|uniref:Uncharacterized protein n=1 Tax=Zasmidium cellare ATCC 36951 TaxID=1080233 RepID=A0A6A6CWP2_ZASCE|nr:uncharacterized protein M409DRAFT_64570 [Zasmidium cellare ATCC 36951]KAF2170242.1 hypothetical protein M409DRAFT_64570 [Zasmidium cellare ATCC 36951]